MNWIKGFDRIIFILAIPVFILAAGFNLIKLDSYPNDYTFLLDPNPAYEIWAKQYEKEWEKHIRETPPIDFEAGFSEDVPIPPAAPPSPPERYLPIKTYKKVLFAIGIGLIASLVWIGVLCGTTRLIRISGKFIIGGFKK